MNRRTEIRTPLWHFAKADATKMYFQLIRFLKNKHKLPLTDQNIKPTVTSRVAAYGNFISQYIPTAYLFK